MEIQCCMCKDSFDNSTMLESDVYYPISKDAEESRKQGMNPFELGTTIVYILEHLHLTEEEKARCRYDLEHNYEFRTRRYCRKCAPVANVTRIGKSEWRPVT